MCINPTRANKKQNFGLAFSKAVEIHNETYIDQPESRSDETEWELVHQVHRSTSKRNTGISARKCK